MSQELLPRFPFGPMYEDDLEKILHDIASFTGFFWIQYEEQYPHLEIPTGVITVGPNFLAYGSRDRLYNKLDAVKAGEIDINFKRMSRTNPLNVGGFGPNGNIEFLFRSLKQNGKLLSAYCLFPADETEWKRIKGSPNEESRSDDYQILNYNVEGKEVKIWVFDVLSKINRLNLNTDGSQAITYDPTVFNEL